MSIRQFIKCYVSPVLLPVIFLFAMAFFVTDNLPMEKSKLNLIIVAATSGLMIIISFLIVLMTFPYYKSQFKKILLQIS
jgi:hypothetical protein